MPGEQRLQGGAGRDAGGDGDEPGGIRVGAGCQAGVEVDGEGAEPDAWPQAPAAQHQRRQRDAGRRPDRGGVSGWQGQRQTGGTGRGIQHRHQQNPDQPARQAPRPGAGR